MHLYVVCTEQRGINIRQCNLNTLKGKFRRKLTLLFTKFSEEEKEEEKVSRIILIVEKQLFV